MKRVRFEPRYFGDDEEWDYFLYQLGIPEKKRKEITFVEVEVVGIDAEDIDGNKVIL